MGAAAIYPWVLYRSTTYDPIVALTALGTIGLVWYTFGTFWAVQYQRLQTVREKSEQTAALASALLAELQVTSGNMKVVSRYVMDESRAALFAAPLLEEVVRDPSRLPNEVAGEAVRYLIGIRYTRELVEHLRGLKFRRADPERQKRRVGDNETQSALADEMLQNEIVATERSVQWQAWYAWRHAVTLTGQLVDLGGIMPTEPVGDAPASTGLPPRIASDPFPRPVGSLEARAE